MTNPLYLNRLQNTSTLPGGWWAFWAILVIVYFLAIPTSFAAASKSSLPLTLQEAEALALQANLKGSKKGANDTLSQVKDFSDKSRDSGMTFDVQNLMVNSAPINQGDNTVFKVGFQQRIPSGDLYTLQSEQAQALTSFEFKKHRSQIRSLNRAVRTIWLDLYYWAQAQQIVASTQDYLNDLAKGRPQKITAEINPTLTQLSQLQYTIQNQINAARQQLGPLVGDSNISRPLPTALPTWPKPAKLTSLQGNLSQHPKLQEDSANIQAIRAGSSAVKEKGKSSFGIGASYGVRQNEFMAGDPKPDSFSAELKFHLSSNAEQQQNKITRANAATLEAAQLQQEKDYRQLTQDLVRSYTDWEKYQQQVQTLVNRLPAAIKQVNADSQAYQTGHGNIHTLVNAYRAQLQLQLDILRAEVSLTQARVNLLYFE